MNAEKTCTYFKRSKSSPLNISLQNTKVITHFDVISSVIPQIIIYRLRSLAIRGHILPVIFKHPHCPVPLLEKLDICITEQAPPGFCIALFGGELPSLREFSVSGVSADLSWRNMKNLRVFTLSNPEAYVDDDVSVTQVLDFFESTPLLQQVYFVNPMPDSSDAPPGRIVPLRHLKTLNLSINQPPSILLNHLHIPTGVALMLRDRVQDEEPSPLDYLPDKSPNCENLSHITMVNLHLERDTKSMLLAGPSGSLRLAGRLRDPEALSAAMVDHRILRSIGPPRLPTIQRLTITRYTHAPQAGVEECPVFQTLSSLDTLRALVLSDCNNLAFILALNPEKNASALVPCPNLEELVIYHLLYPRREYVGDLVDMSRSRDSGGAKLSSITIVDTLEFMEESKLQEHATHVEYRCHQYRTKRPAWDDVPDQRMFEES